MSNPFRKVTNDRSLLVLAFLFCISLYLFSSLDLSLGGLTYSDQFLQITTKLASKNIYGFGENRHPSFRHDLNYKTWPMFSRDQPPGQGVSNTRQTWYFCCQLGIFKVQVQGTRFSRHLFGTRFNHNTKQVQSTQYRLIF